MLHYYYFKLIIVKFLAFCVFSTLQPGIASSTNFHYFLPMPRYAKFFISLSFLLLLSVVACCQSIYKTPSGKKYHLGSCRMVENVSEKITRERAMELRLEPCKICKPDIAHLQPSFENKAKGQSISVQCKGITKQGTRCRHNTRIANGYCFQHQPR